jgi:hypothetical protein
MSESAAQEEYTQHAPNLASKTVTEQIRERPLLSAGLAAFAGFVMGGGAFTRTGSALLMLMGRIWVRRAVTETIANAISGHGHPGPNGAG